MDSLYSVFSIQFYWRGYSEMEENGKNSNYYI